MYNWENSASAHRKKVKKTGTVVLHTDKSVDASFDRLLKEFPVERVKHTDAGEESEHSTAKAPLMTSDTIAALKEKMRFEDMLPCQAQCYRGIFNGRDVILHSRTGSGKTFAYALPLIERHLIMEKGDNTSGPFLLIFVFGNDLAVQTKNVLSRVYSQLRIGVAGMDDMTNGTYDILVGTLRAMDEAIRGRKVAAAATAAEEEEKAVEARIMQQQQKGSKRPRTASKEEDDDAANASDEDDDDTSAVGGAVSATNVRAIVVDEVDSTLGPRFSMIGRRMKNLLKFIRKANGSLTKGLLQDYRAHHYVLCGATIPNWVIKAGFLGVKKYYYQLVDVGSRKLPAGLECFKMACPMNERVATATRFLTDAQQKTLLGRVVVFGTNRQITQLEEVIKKAGKVSARVLMPSRSEKERITSIEDFNSGAANVLLCTDYAARGLDFVKVDTVLMLSLPHGNMAAETFVHRAGRTARVDRVGRCILLHDSAEADTIDAIVKSAHVTFKRFSSSTQAAGSSSTTMEGAGRKSAGKSKKASEGDADAATFQLTVKNPFKYSKPNATVPSAHDVLKKQLSEALLASVAHVEEVAGTDGEAVRFQVPGAVAHEVKQQLWKYDVKEL